jgi:hypothetical protein
VSCPTLGLLESVRVWHDNSGRYPDWFLDEIRVRKKVRSSQPAGLDAMYMRVVAPHGQRWHGARPACTR